MADLVPKYKLVGPFSPKEFSDTSTLSTSIATAVGTLDGTSTTSLIASDPIIVLGNIFILVTFV